MSDVIFTVENGVAKIVLNRPDSLNAFSLEMIDLWIEALETVRDSEDIRVLVLSGNGRGFCSGGDIKSMIKGEGFLQNDGEKDFSSTALARKNSLWKKVQRIPLLVQEIDIPVIAVLHGFAFGAGFDMSLACDIRIAAENTKISESYLNVGIVPGDGAAWFLPRFVGTDVALDLLWNRTVLSAQQAKDLRLVTHVVPDEQLQEFVDQYVEKLAAGPQAAMKFTKRAVYQGLNTDLRTAYDYISSAMGIVTELEDYQEGVRSVIEKRNPSFK